MLKFVCKIICHSRGLYQDAVLWGTREKIVNRSSWVLTSLYNLLQITNRVLNSRVSPHFPAFKFQIVLKLRHRSVMLCAPPHFTPLPCMQSYKCEVTSEYHRWDPYPYRIKFAFSWTKLPCMYPLDEECGVYVYRTLTILALTKGFLPSLRGLHSTGYRTAPRPQWRTRS